MIPTQLDRVSADDLHRLIIDGTPEGRTLEYKLTLPGSRDIDKREFLADASSFANTAGGDILFGVREENGEPRESVGISSGDIDNETQRLESLLRTGLEPRLPRYSFHSIPIRDGAVVVALRVWRSWLSPHRVSFRDHAKFYGRNSTGKYPLDVGELRTAFSLLNHIEEKMQGFHASRLLALEQRETPVTLVDGGLLALHLLPTSAFSLGDGPDLSRYMMSPHELPDPIGSQAIGDGAPNLEGVFRCSGQLTQSKSYVQLFRSGALESVCVLRLDEKRRRAQLGAETLQNNVLAALSSYCEALRSVEAQPPVRITATMFCEGGFQLRMPGTTEVIMDRVPTFSKSLLPLQSAWLEDLSDDIGSACSSMFDSLWNAFGFPRAIRYDRHGMRLP